MSGYNRETHCRNGHPRALGEKCKECVREHNARRYALHRERIIAERAAKRISDPTIAQFLRMPRVLCE